LHDFLPLLGSPCVGFDSQILNLPAQLLGFDTRRVSFFGGIGTAASWTS
jgi:hypothetical protein